MWFGTGKNQRYIPLHLVAQSIGIEKCLALPLFHALTGCDQVSFFAGRGKKVAWKTWKQYDELTDALQSIAFCPPKETMETVLHVIERFLVLLYDRTSICTRVNDCRIELFGEKRLFALRNTAHTRCPQIAYSKGSLPSKLLLGTIIVEGCHATRSQRMGMEKSGFAVRGGVDDPARGFKEVPRTYTLWL